MICMQFSHNQGEYDNIQVAKEMLAIADIFVSFETQRAARVNILQDKRVIHELGAN